MNGKIYVAGGEGSGGRLLSSIEVYTPSTSTWSHVADLPINVTDLGCTAFGSSFYMAGGWTLSGSLHFPPLPHEDFRKFPTSFICTYGLYCLHSPKQCV